ncbi:probable inactive serine/threonine-protein kinase bub1 isoform X1 [Biomphalaria glabrata]|uniref:Probable inactive serine/threonine-protein kinase bub1 isoform X1 n=1 Tax=Biomphalaria glabrata TaxID=6526 RepID=A0A9W3ANP1_BIOGL|nr:probable inactive serine/threonine-protein kinase bub1 isoform X1 [Biomphalaria glabrata]XP_055888915.1 probable inactive serine/threonine-protein kinase bub1 isoform X1 [Biomphalaria glabrata]XP_055888917.1 probable inactive serine/threonine-protein kinase bub1 isoform X1 [Biomphalaria glabrata]XP_055888918.1 probable inactive serine/threonine-protein kinase bub1 isoform X1 [Biomphalaria glabrata]XP_055888919.1 probable inactive serine/threonine-protein kinase bub1 isoform X1 [Biomphalaria 
MASSSVSQESLDMEDLDISRRNRTRVHRVHSGRGVLPYRAPPDCIDGELDKDGDHQNGESNDTLGFSSQGHLPADHESPTRGAAARLKEKRNVRSHMKGKLPKDKRKLREKRRSTGVVHCIPSTESTGDSLDDEDDDEETSHDTKKNTNYNEGTGRHHESTHESRYSSNTVYSQRRNKSPSDLEADLEDNQDYDSTVSHSETNLSIIGRSQSSEVSVNLPRKQVVGSGNSTYHTATFSSKFSPESNRAQKFELSSDADSSSKTNASSASSCTSSFLSRYCDGDSPQSTAGNSTGYNDATPESDSPHRKFASQSTNAASDVGQSLHTRPVNFSVLRDSSNSQYKSDKTSHFPSASRFREQELGSSKSTSGVGTIATRLASYQTPRPFVPSGFTSVTSQQQQNETIAQLEKLLEKEKEENKRLQRQLEEKDKKITELEKAIELLNEECDGLDEDNIKLQEENKALIRAMSKLTSNV